MIDRKQFATELQLRSYIRKAIRLVEEKRITEENQLRKIVRALINESDPAVSISAVHSNTGINALEDLFKNTNLLSVLRTGYKALTSKKEQRESYKSHILNAVELSLETENNTYNAPGEDIETEEKIELNEQDINIDIGGRPEDNPAFIDVEKKNEPTEEEEIETFSLTGQDKTGRNRAYTDYKDVEKNIITAYDDLDDPSDRTMFQNYILTNLKLYFDRFEEELQTDLPEPDIQVPDEAQTVSAGPMPPPDVEEMLEWLVLNHVQE